MLGVGFRIGLCALALALSACGTLSVQEEKQMGAQAQSQLRKQLTFVRDQRLQRTRVSWPTGAQAGTPVARWTVDESAVAEAAQRRRAWLGH